MTRVSVTAVFDDLDGSPRYEKAVELSISRVTVHGPVLQMHGGPTGYESLYVYDYTSDRPPRDWPACAGTPGRWKQCVVPAPEMVRALGVLGIA